MDHNLAGLYTLLNPHNHIYTMPLSGLGGKSKGSPMSKERKEFDKQYQGIGRNNKCPCGSGAKFKNCCLKQRPK